MTQLTRAQLYQYGQQAGFTGAALDEVVAIAFAESSGNTTHVNVNGASVTKIGGKTTNVPAGTKDRGVLQINDWWNPSVSDACAFDPVCSFQWAYKVTGGKQPSASSDPFFPYWVTVQTGAYKKYLTPGGGGNSNSGGSIVDAINGAISGATTVSTGSTDVGTGMAQLTGGISSLISQVNDIHNAAPSALIRTGLFIIILVVLGVGLFIFANSEELH